ncbi:hypothetical protein H310_04769 [Aphanomyces invadans]|uniref:WRKY19-like zinc finger domain-containing protein n=1 Tax=Aphanomyces invadans TaxID=157072 RepID=A0A024UFY5_9STRA|nr:hypothetical protein H310_04769 [Aphanomyces invadans]ETW04533.1 hypothetical protein H310_04769 [Aphanomyces invadans]|eukprot:XP_008867489.1 hypothetical protein H310_04769 [Aphanomyces invadans]
MQVEHQNYYSTATAIMQPHPHSCRYPNSSSKGAYTDVKDELALPPLQAFQYDRHQQYSTQPMPEPCPSYFQPSAQGASYQQQQQQQPPATYHPQHHHYDPYPHSSYHQPYAEQHTAGQSVRSMNKHLDPALLEEALNECMPFIEPIMTMTTSPYHDQNNTNGTQSRHGSRYDSDPSASASYAHFHHQQQLSHHLPAHAPYPQYSSSVQQHDALQAQPPSLRHNLSSTLSHYAPSDGSAVSISQSPSNDGKSISGAARLCRVPNCNKGIRSRGLCKGHGGGRRCQTAGCKISDQGGGHCIAHGGGRRCSVKDCTRSAQARGLCKCHGGGRPCKYAGCTKNSQRSGYCMAHGKLMAVASTSSDSQSTDEGRSAGTRHGLQTAAASATL